MILMFSFSGRSSIRDILCLTQLFMEGLMDFKILN